MCGSYWSFIRRKWSGVLLSLYSRSCCSYCMVGLRVLSLTYMAATSGGILMTHQPPGFSTLHGWRRSLTAAPCPRSRSPAATMVRYGGVSTWCQSWPLALQLQAGVRFLDVRVRHVKGNLTIHHGVVYQQAHFGDVLEDVAAFLYERPTEAVLMRLKEEFSKTNDIYGSGVSYIHRYAHWNLLWHSRLVPTMTQARRKLIILQDFAGPDLGMRYGSLDIADEWKVPTFLHLPAKWETVQKHFAGAEAGKKAQMFLTYSCGAGIFTYPISVARHINARLLDHLALRAGKHRRYEIVAMDFPAALLLQTIINFN